MPLQTFSFGEWAEGKWATDHHKRLLSFKKQHKSKDGIWNFVKGTTLVQLRAQETEPVTVAIVSNLTIEKRKNHIWPAFIHWVSTEKFQNFSIRKEIQINSLSMVYCTLANLSFYSSHPQSSLFGGFPETWSSGLFFMVPLISLFHWFLLMFDTVDCSLFYKTISVFGSHDASLSSCLTSMHLDKVPFRLFPKFFLKCHLQLYSPLRCSKMVLCIWRRQGSYFSCLQLAYEAAGHVPRWPGIADRPTPEGTCVDQWQGSCQNKNV